MKEGPASQTLHRADPCKDYSNGKATLHGQNAKNRPIPSPSPAQSPFTNAGLPDLTDSQGSSTPDSPSGFKSGTTSHNHGKSFLCTALAQKGLTGWRERRNWCMDAGARSSAAQYRSASEARWTGFSERNERVERQVKAPGKFWGFGNARFGYCYFEKRQNRSNLKSILPTFQRLVSSAASGLLFFV